VKGLSCKVFDTAELKQKKMGGILPVGSGSASGPRLIVLRYKIPENPLILPLSILAV